MGGYSIAGKISRGHWTRLYARAFYFQDASESVTLVSCDLFAVPRGLHARVAQALAAEGVTPDGLILAATHTHQGPGNYMSSRFYNGFASPLPGFSSDLFEFLAQRITSAVRQAIFNARQSQKPAMLVLKSGRIDGLVRNRSFEAFQKNPDRNELIGQGPAAPPDCSAPCDRYRAVDPTVTVLEIRHGTAADSKRTAVLVFFAVHPTAMSNHFGLYNPDLAGRAMRQLERATSDAGLVAGFFNGAEGDVSPNWKERDVVEVRALGDVLANQVQRVLDETQGISEASPQIRARLREVSRSDFCRGVEPLFGVASVGGAADGYTALHELGWSRGPNAIREEDLIPGQGNKQPALDAKWLPQLGITKAVGPPKHLPRDVPVSFARLGPLLLAAVPVEMTTATGRRLRRKLAPDGTSSLVLIGLANEYLSYVATPEEYALQDYEGASTIFGPAEADCFSTSLEAAAAELGQPPERDIAGSVFPSGPKAHFGPEFWIEQPLWWPAGLEKLVVRSSTIPPKQWPRFEWSSSHSGGLSEAADQQVFVHQKQGEVWRVVETEDDSHLLILLIDGRLPRRWNATWMPPDGVDRDSTLAFQVVHTDGVVQCSAPFSIRRIRDGQVPLPLPRGNCSSLKEP
jgi:neutral ceramidase